MSEYSQEYFELIDQELIGDFSYKEEFLKLKENECYFEICEGLGTIGITRIKENMYFLFNNEKVLVEYSLFINHKKHSI